MIRLRSSCSPVTSTPFGASVAILRLMSSMACSASLTCPTCRAISASASVRSRTFSSATRLTAAARFFAAVTASVSLVIDCGEAVADISVVSSAVASVESALSPPGLAHRRHDPLVGVRAGAGRAERRVHAAPLGGQERRSPPGWCPPPAPPSRSRRATATRARSCACRSPASSRWRRCSRWCRPAAPRRRGRRRRCSARSRCSCGGPFAQAARVSASGWWFPAASRRRSG